MPVFLPHCSFLYVLQLVGRAQDNFHTPPIVVALQTPPEHVSATRCWGGARPRVAAQQERAGREREREREEGERERESAQLVTDPAGDSSNQFVSLIGGAALFLRIAKCVILGGLKETRRALWLEKKCLCVSRFVHLLDRLSIFGIFIEPV